MLLPVSGGMRSKKITVDQTLQKLEIHNITKTCDSSTEIGTPLLSNLGWKCHRSHAVSLWILAIRTQSKR
jgi:hypothetical protein